MQEQYLDLKKYISVVTQLSFIASTFAKECSQKNDLKVYQKKQNDHVTQADYKIQTLIINGLRHFFPKIRIVGQQTIDYQGEIKVDYTDISTQNYPQILQLDLKAPLQQFCVWIDPIDNTKGFINGKLDYVTILIGLSRNKKSYIGITTLPFCKQNEKIIYKPQVLLGIRSLSKAFSSFEKNNWITLQRPQENIPHKIVVSDSKQTVQTIKDIATVNKAEIHRLGGSGIKIAFVAKGKMDTLIYSGAFNHKWDTCSGQAIILALGGQFSDILGNPIEYDPNNKQTMNFNGNLCSFNKDIMIQTVQSFNKLKL